MSDVDATVEALCGDLSAVRAPRGTALNALSWQTEAPLRMLLNNLDPEVAEHPEELVVYGGSGRAARSHEALRDIVRTLLRLRDDETLLVQSGKPVGVFRTHEGAPRVLIANSLLVPKWATWDEFRRLEAEGLTMFGQMTAGSWIYIGTQGILQGTYQTFCAAGEVHFGSADLSGRTDPDGRARRHGRRAAARGDDGRGGDPLRRGRPAVDRPAARDALRRRAGRLARRRRRARAGRGRRAAGRSRWRCSGTRPTSSPSSWRAASTSTSSRTRPPPTIRSPATCRPRCRSRRLPALRARDPKRYLELASQSIVTHVRAMCEFVRMGCYVFDYGNNLRGEAYAGGLSDAFSYPGFVPAYIRPLFCRGIGPFRWAVLSGDPADIEAIDRELQGLFPDDILLQRWLAMAPEKVAFQGLPARICWLGYGDRARAGLAINELVRTGRVSAPVVIGRDHLDSGSVASPYRETEAMRDGSDAIADWPILNALLNTAAGATWVSVHHGGGVGIGNSIHSGMVVLADGTRRRGRAARAGAHRRSRARASCAMPTPATPRRSTPRARAGSTCRASPVRRRDADAVARRRAVTGLLIRDLAQVATPGGSGGPLRGAGAPRRAGRRGRVRPLPRRRRSRRSARCAICPRTSASVGGDRRSRARRDPGSRRLPHPRVLRRRPGQRVLAPRRRRLVRGAPRRGRRHPLDRARDPRGRRGRARPRSRCVTAPGCGRTGRRRSRASRATGSTTTPSSRSCGRSAPPAAFRRGSARTRCRPSSTTPTPTSTSSSRRCCPRRRSSPRPPTSSSSAARSTPRQARRYLEACRDAGLALRLHGDQFTESGAIAPRDRARRPLGRPPRGDRAGRRRRSWPRATSPACSSRRARSSSAGRCPRLARSPTRAR